MYQRRLAISTDITTRRTDETDPDSAVTDLAAALEIVGARWALLIVERLLDGPQRYGDLQRDLGLGTNMLAVRLRELEAAGVLYRLPLRHNTRAYALTERGLALSTPIAALGQWAAQKEPTAGESHH
jgi:DNA-binding HxlR family transcriptional regulator